MLLAGGVSRRGVHSRCKSGRADGLTSEGGLHGSDWLRAEASEWAGSSVLCGTAPTELRCCGDAACLAGRPSLAWRLGARGNGRGYR